MNRNILFLVAVLVLLIGVSASAQHYTDWTEFEFTRPTDEADFYEVQRDYTISLPSYFLDADNLPPTAGGRLDFMRLWATNLPVIDWDFVRIDQGGILTIKKGFRWDGATLPFWRDLGDFTIRSSMVHDALYNLMRLKYLAADHNHWVWCIDKKAQKTEGDFNRMLADMMIYMIAVEDGQRKSPLPGANNDNRILRKYAACRTHNIDYLYDFQPHVSELTAYASDGKVELTWKQANSSGVWPRFGPDFDPYVALVIHRSDGEEFVLDPPMNFDSFIDINVVNGESYTYWIRPGPTNGNRHDESNLDVAFPIAGAGSALRLDGVNDWVEANTTSNDLKHNFFPFPASELTIEAWVYPEQKDGRSVIAAFNTVHGNRSNVLYYDGDTHKFCYNDLDVGICTDDEFPVDNWYHVAVSLNAFYEGVLFVNGEEQATFTSSTRPDWGTKFSIGQEWSHSTTARHFMGMIDELRVWSVARSQAHILADWCHPLLGDESGLAGLWHFDEPHETHFFEKTHDATSNANDGLLTGYTGADLPFEPSLAMDAECGPAVIDTVEVVAIEIDIKPGSCPNPLNVKEKKENNGQGNGMEKSVLPVAILGGEEFDVNDIVPESIALEGISPTRFSYEDVGTPVDKSEDSCACTEEEGDGFDDLALKFNRADIIRVIMADGPVYDGGDTKEGQTDRTLISLTLTAQLTDGTEIEGYDCVVLMTKDIKGGATAVEIDGSPVRLALIGNHPNPFNPTTNISFSVPSATKVRIEIFNVLGQQLETLIDGSVEAGNHTIEWDASGFASGIYLYRLDAGDYVESRKMLLLK